MLKKDSAICIRTTDFSETSQVIILFTKDSGKISALAKGSKRPKNPFEGPIEIFTTGRIVYSESGKGKLVTLTEFEQKIPFTFLTKNLFALHCASFAAELLNLTIEEHDRHPDLFDAFIEFLKTVNESQVTGHERRVTLALLILFQLSLLRETGLTPIFDHCVNCKTRYDSQDTRYEFFFSNEANGLICRDCQMSFPDKIPILKASADCLNNIKRIVNADETTIVEIEKLLISRFTYNLGKQPKLAKYVIKK